MSERVVTVFLNEIHKVTQNKFLTIYIFYIVNITSKEKKIR